jgi:hypothetical protein
VIYFKELSLSSNQTAPRSCGEKKWRISGIQSAGVVGSGLEYTALGTCLLLASLIFAYSSPFYLYLATITSVISNTNK